MRIEPEWGSTDMGEHRGGPDLSEPERRFNRRWRELVDAAGGQGRVARLLACGTSTVSRDYLGWTLPRDDRARQLCRHLELGRDEEGALLTLLERARPAYHARRRGADPGAAAGTMAPEGGEAGAVPAPAAGAGAPDRESRHARVPTERKRSRRGRRVALASVAVGVSVVAAVLAAVVLPGHAPGPVVRASGAPVARGTYSGLAIRVIPISGSLLAPAVAAAFPQGATARQGRVDGYAFRNIKNPRLCLTAADTGPDAGQNRDRVDVEACDYAPNQVWIPEQWEAAGSSFTQLVSFRYQSKCLNAQYIGGLANGHKTQLWNCYQSPNEYWDFGDWYQSVKGHGRAYPIFVQSAPLCLDADKNDFGGGGAGAQVNIWKQYAAANQFWS